MNWHGGRLLCCQRCRHACLSILSDIDADRLLLMHLAGLAGVLIRSTGLFALSATHDLSHQQLAILAWRQAQGGAHGTAHVRLMSETAGISDVCQRPVHLQ